MVDFKKLMAERKANSQASFKARVEAVNKTNDFEKKEDTRYWQPTVDDAGNGYAVIRFLDSPPGEDNPFVRIWTHGFKGPSGKWYIENSLTTLGLPDPVAGLNSELWNSGVESNKEIARKQKRRLGYHSNILVVNDPKHPENNGKVFLFNYGKKIYDKLKDAMSPPPEFADETPMDPFNMWEGANFKLKIRKVEGYRNYDKSEFESPSAVGDDDEIEAIFGQMHSLTELVDPKHFKSYDELKKNLECVLSASPTATKTAGDHKPDASADDDVIDYEAEAAKREVPVRTGTDTKPAKTAAKPAASKKANADPDGDEDDEMEFFRNLAGGESADNPF
jgi:hypothetical protein